MALTLRDEYWLNEREDRFEDYLKILEKTECPTKVVLGYTGEISALFENTLAWDQANFFGGYAVLAQLVRRFGNEIIPIWRGSHDIDMQGTYIGLKGLERHFDIPYRVANHNLSDKKRLAISPNVDSEGLEIKIDYTIRDR